MVPPSETVLNQLQDKPKKAKPRKPKMKTVKKLDTHVLTDYNDERYKDMDEVEDSRKSGVRLHPLLPMISRVCLKRDPPADEAADKLHVRCIASSKCNTLWVHPRNKRRVIGHAADVSECPSMPAELRDEAINAMAQKAIGDKFRMPDVSTSASRLLDGPSTNLKRTRTESDAGTVASTSKKPMLDVFITEGNKALKTNGDYALMLFITCAGVPPSIVDSDHFKKLVGVLNPAYKPPSSSTLAEKLIPEEAAKILQGMIAFFKTCRNCTITFDGGKSKRNGLYTIHITTADRRSFCVEIDDASRLSHTANYVFEILSRVHSTCLTDCMPSDSKF
jgi:hypothetical protein